MTTPNQRLWIPAFFVLGAIIGIAGMYVYLQNMPTAPVSQNPIVSVPSSPTTTEAPTGTDYAKPPSGKLSAVMDDLKINWTKPKKISMMKAFDELKKPWWEGGSTAISPTDEAYDLGTVSDGVYKGYHLIKWIWGEEGMGGGEFFVNVLQSPDQTRWVAPIMNVSARADGFGPDGEEASRKLDVWMTENFILHESIGYQVTKLPDTLTLKNGAVITATVVNDTRFTCTSKFCASKKIADTKEGFSVYGLEGIEMIGRGFGDSSGGCVLAFSEDGTAHSYNVLQPSLLTVVGDGKIASPIKSNIINWNAGIPRSNVEYDPRGTGGCGGHNCVEVVSDAEVNAAGGIVEAGTLLNEKIYIPRDLKNHPIVKTAYEGWLTFEERKTMDQFLQAFPVPVFFQKDGLGRWVRFQITNSFPQAECGKPVIYLYPEKTTNVSVKLPRFIDVTVSDPTYPEAGWKVTAQPNGSLLSHADGKTYSSLYWEGTGVSYETPRTGFVVKGTEIESFLTRTLPKYGLNETEARDFKEFWVPIMQKQNLMRVSFLTDSWSKAAPLNVSPAPRTNIRIFMDWMPLASSINIAAPRIVTPERDGFTLVEWGGTLYR